MADNEAGRDKQAHDEENRQREREIAAEIERMGEPEPPVPPAVLADLEAELDTLSYPVTGSDVVSAVGDQTVDASADTHTVAELLPDSEQETFRSPSAVRERVQRPTVAAAMKRIVETADRLQVELEDAQRTAYVKTLGELQRIDADDDDEGITVITDWILDNAEKKEKLPGSRDVRREAASFCRENDYQIRNDDWLGI